MMNLTWDEVLDVVRAELARELRIPVDCIAATDRMDLLQRADSVRLMRVIAHLETAYDTEFEDTQIRGADTVGDLVSVVLAATQPAGAP